MGESEEETSIVTSSGNFVIAWDFKAVKRGKYDKYEIRRYVLLTSPLHTRLISMAALDTRISLYKISSSMGIRTTS